MRWLAVLALAACSSPAAESSPDAPNAPDADTRGAGCIAKLALGSHHSCVLRKDGAVWCWGANNTAQLNDRTEVDATVPREVFRGAKDLVSGLQHLCAIDHDDALWCWGRDAFGQIGNATNTHSELATRVPIDRVTAVAGGNLAEHVCARDVDGALWCWGRNDYAQLGLGHDAPTYSPARTTVATALPALGSEYSCTLDEASHVVCWGRNVFGAMGISSPGGPTPQRGAGDATFVSLTAGGTTTCGLTAEGGVECWGDGAQGQLGGPLESITPVHLLDDADLVRMGSGSICARKLDGTVWCWGKNQYGGLATGTTDYPPGPVPTLLADVVDLALGNLHGCALTRDGGVACWGYDGYGQLGRGGLPNLDPHPTPQTVPIPCE